MKTPLQKLSEWYAQQCNGDWEHGRGIRISTIDNPGFALGIDLCETDLESIPYPDKTDCYDTDDQWMICRRTEEKFEGRCAPARLEDVVAVFLQWAENQKQK